MEKIEEEGNAKEKMDSDVDSSSKHVEEFQAEKHDKDPNVLMDPNLKRTVSNRSAKRSRKNAKYVKKLEARAEMLQDLFDILQPIVESQKKQMRDLMEEEQALLQEMKYLEEKALLREAENEKKMNMLMELQKMEQEELVMFDIDPLDPEFNDAPPFQDGGSGSQSS